MRTEIRSLTEQDLDAAARLLAERHRADRSRTPALPSHFDDPAAVRPQIVTEFERPLARGVAAMRGDELVGFLIGTVSWPPPGAWYAGYGPRRSGEVAYAGYAAAGPEPRETYREMYAALAPFFIEYGAFTHGIELNAGDPTATDAWFSLGFGQVTTLAVRDTVPVATTDAATPGGIEFHRAAPEEIEVVMTLGDHLDRHHNSPPIYLPYLPEESNPGFRVYLQELLAKPENAHWIAERGGQPIGMQTFHEQDFAEMARPGRSVYLFVGVTTPDARGGGLGTAILRHSMQWARDEGYERCTLHFLSANIAAARFWLRSGFQPLTQR
ncbi:MAG: GNAT family N-acetyltransferase, partial [Dehalococcoidia bacterium]